MGSLCVSSNDRALVGAPLLRWRACEGTSRACPGRDEQGSAADGRLLLRGNAEATDADARGLDAPS